MIQQVMRSLAASLDPGQTLDILELALTSALPAAQGTEVRHAFTPGLYSRTFTMPAGSMVISETHLTEHQYVVSQGRCLVYNQLDGSIEEIAAPFHGRTMPGTRRLIFIHEDTVWTTFHATTETDPEVIKSQITKQRTLPQP